MRALWIGIVGVVGLLCSSALFAYDGQCDSLDEIENLPPRHWCEIPQSDLRQAEKKPSEFSDWDGASSEAYQSFQRVMGIRGVTEAWNSAAVDSKRNCLLVTGGGHNDYGGNEIYRFCLGTLAWDRVSDPTPFPNRHPEYVNPDGTPISRHTYGGVVYLPSVDRMFLFDGSPDYGPGTCSTRGTWTFDLAARASSGAYSTGQWELRTDENEPSRGCDNVAVYDPLSGNVIFKSGGGTYEYDFGANQWTKVSGSGRRTSQVNLAVDPSRQLLVEVGGGKTAVWSIGDGYSGGDVATSGSSAIEAADDPGLVYDTRIGKIVGWSGGTSVYTFDVEGKVWSEIPAASANLADPGPVTTSGGVFGRFNYFPDYNVYVYVNRVDDNVFVYRLSDTEAPSIPKPPSDFTAP